MIDKQMPNQRNSYIHSNQIWMKFHIFCVQSIFTLFKYVQIKRQFNNLVSVIDKSCINKLLVNTLFVCLKKNAFFLITDSITFELSQLLFTSFNF